MQSNKKQAKPNRRIQKTQDESGIIVVETAELESATSCMSSMRSNQLSYASVTTLALYHILFTIASPFSKFFKLFFGETKTTIFRIKTRFPAARNTGIFLAIPLVL